MITLGRQHLHDLTKGTVIAMQGLREYQAVVEAAVAVFAGKIEWSKELQELHRALVAGGWIE